MQFRFGILTHHLCFGNITLAIFTGVGFFVCRAVISNCMPV